MLSTRIKSGGDRGSDLETRSVYTDTQTYTNEIMYKIN